MSEFLHSSTHAGAAGNMAAGDIYVRHTGPDLERLFAGLQPEQINLVSRRAAARTRDWLLTQVRRELAAKGEVPQNAIKGRLRRGRKSAYSEADNSAVLWVGLNPLAAARAGKPRQLKSDAKAGRHHFDRAFVARIYSGRDQIWRRLGNRRFPVIKMTVPLNEHMEGIAARYEELAAEMFATRLRHEVNHLISQAGR